MRAARRLAPYLYAVGGVALITAGIGVVQSRTNVPNRSMVYLLLVLWLGARYGSLPATIAGIGAFVAYDFFFVPPVGSFVVSAPHELVGLILLLATALVTGQLASSLRRESERNAELAEEARALYELAITALRLPDAQAAIALVSEKARSLPGVKLFTLVAIENGKARVAGDEKLSPDLLRRSEWTFEHRTSVGARLGPSGVDLVRTSGINSEPAMIPLAGGVAVLEIGAGAANDHERRMLAALLGLGSLLLDRRAAAYQAQRASSLEASDSLKAAVLSSLSHELKSPIAALRAGLTSLIGPAAGLDREHQELVAGLDHEAARLDRLVGELLIMSRLEAGQALELEPRSFPELSGALVDRLQPRIAGRELVVKLPADLPEVLMDELQIDRVLTNLLENALDFTPSAGRIELGARAEGDRLVAWVDNEGPMIPAADLGSIFDKFWTGRSGGTGLGLAICKRIIEGHGGTIEVRNRRSGPRFQFTLPLAPVKTKA
jgi:two-component system sensor histidine kinase KdpD